MQEFTMKLGRSEGKNFQASFAISTLPLVMLFIIILVCLGIYGIIIFGTYIDLSPSSEDNISILEEKIDILIDKTIEAEEEREEMKRDIAESMNILNYLFKPTEISSINSNMRSFSMLTPWQLDEMYKGTAMEGLGIEFFRAERLYGVNAEGYKAMAALESANGTSGFARNRYNYFGWNAPDSNPSRATRFNSPTHGILTVARSFSNGYLNPDGRFYIDGTVKGINRYYASDPNWDRKIVSIANSRRI